MAQTTMLDPVAEEFVERLGVALEFFGLSRIAGRILAYLTYHPGPASFDDLTTSLQVSRGSVSTNTRHLELLGVIQRVSQPGERVDYFKVTPDSESRFLEAWFAHVDEVEGIIADTLDKLPPEAGDTRSRIEYVDRFYRFVLDRIHEITAEWRDTLAGEAADARAQL